MCRRQRIVCEISTQLNRVYQESAYSASFFLFTKSCLFS